MIFCSATTKVHYPAAVRILGAALLLLHRDHSWLPKGSSQPNSQPAGMLAFAQSGRTAPNQPFDCGKPSKGQTIVVMRRFTRLFGLPLALRGPLPTYQVQVL
jgi:hypothetical protein